MAEPITQMLMKTKHIRDIGLSGAQDITTFYSPYDGIVEVVQGSLVTSKEGLMNVNPKLQVSLKVGENLVELPYGSLIEPTLIGQQVTEGDKLYQVNNGVMLYSPTEGTLSVEDNVLEVTSKPSFKVTFDSRSFSVNNVKEVKAGDPLLYVRKYVRNTSEFKKLTYMLGKSNQLTCHLTAEEETILHLSDKGTFQLRMNKSVTTLDIMDRVVFLNSSYIKGDLIALGKDGQDVKKLINVDQIIGDYHDRLKLLYENNDIKVSQVHFEMFIREFLMMCTLKQGKELVSMNYAQLNGLDYTTISRDINRPYEYRKMPFARLSYENVLKYLVDSAIVGDKDEMKDFISNFVVGNPTESVNFSESRDDNS